MKNKINPTRLLRSLNRAHDDISAAHSYLSRIVSVTDPGAARAGLHEMQEQFEHLFAQSLSLKRRSHIWKMTFPALVDSDDTGADSYAAEFFDFYQEAEESDDEADLDAFLDDSAQYADDSGDDDSDDADEDDDSITDEIFADDKCGSQGQDRNEAADVTGFVLHDADLARLFDISEASATAGVRETGYLDIFGAWQDGRRPGPYKRPSTPNAHEDPDYNTPGESV
jgi:hypothetical protein